MGWYWNAASMPGLVAVALSWGALLVVHVATPPHRTNRILKFMLFAEGLIYGTGNGLLYATDSVADGYALQALAFYGGIFLLYAYLLFVGTIPTPLSAWLRGSKVRALLLVALVAHLAAFHVWRPAFFPGMTSAPYARVEGVVGPALELMFMGILVVSIYALVCAVSAWRRAPEGPAKERAKAFAIAFGARDIGIAAMVTLDATIWPEASALGFPFVSIVFVPLLAYGVLKSQLFDIDLKIKWTLRRGTVAAVFLAVFFAVSEGAAAVVENETGSALVGISAAALLVFAIAPLQRAADRIADAAMPRVQETPAYVAFRKMEVYRAALEGAMEDGEVTHKERAMLQRLRESLGLSDADAGALEADLGARAAAG